MGMMLRQNQQTVENHERNKGELGSEVSEVGGKLGSKAEKGGVPLLLSPAPEGLGGAATL